MKASFYSNGSLEAIEAWMITRQLGYQNNYVLKGGLNYFGDLILNPQQPPTTSPDEELAKYDLRSKGQAGSRGRSTNNSSGSQYPYRKIKPGCCTKT